MTSVKWYGQACIILTQQTKEKKEQRIVIDPYGKTIGLVLPSLEADAVIITHDHPDHNNAKAVEKKPFIISEAGEYEIANFSIEAIPAFHDESQGSQRGSTLIIRIQGQEYSFVHFGDIGQKELAPEQIDALGEVDIAFIPVGGTYTVEGKDAARIINQLEPKIAVPIHYAIPQLTIALAGPEEFYEAMGQRPTAVSREWKIKSTDVPSEGTRIIQLEPN